MKTARQVALESLNKINLKGGYSNIVVDNMINVASLDSRDSAFATMLVYGVVERLITLDYIISKYSNIAISNIEPIILQILRLGIYQSLFMDSVPDHAAVSESVELAKRYKKSKATGFINAVLRSSLRNKNKLLDFSDVKDTAHRMSLLYSSPLWLTKMWTTDYGEKKTEEFLKSSVGRAPTFARVNTLKTSPEELIQILQGEGIEAYNHEFENCIVLETPSLAIKSDAFKKGLFHIQDLASQICIKYADIKPDFTVIDVCSAPGGKAFTAAQYMNNKGILLSFDLHEKRVKLIQEGASRLGLSCIQTNVGDAMVFNDTLPLADVVLCDVVCSGLGVIRRKPETKYKNPEDLKRLPEIQKKIINNVSKYVKIGGTIIYSTCTVNRKENEQVVESFLKENDNFTYADKEQKCITLFGNDNNSDGFFMCKCKRLW